MMSHELEHPDVLSPFGLKNPAFREAFSFRTSWDIVTSLAQTKGLTVDRLAKSIDSFLWKMDHNNTYSVYTSVFLVGFALQQSLVGSSRLITAAIVDERTAWELGGRLNYQFEQFDEEVSPFVPSDLVVASAYAKELQTDALKRVLRNTITSQRLSANDRLQVFGVAKLPFPRRILE